jgi:thiamine biosynthesis protein ThiS
MSEPEMQITINGEPRELGDEALSLAELLTRLNVDPAQIAVEKNRDIIPRSRYSEEAVSSGDVIELVEFVGGG